MKLEGKLKAMAGHELKFVEGIGLTRHWMCRNPRDSNAWFRVVTGPHMVCVYGDVGDRIVYHPSNPDMVPWLRGAVQSVEYLVSKMPGTKIVFDPDRVAPVLMERVNEARQDRDFARAREWLACIRELTSFCSITEDYTHQQVSDVDDCYGDWCESFYGPTDDVLWTVAALQTFVRLLGDDAERLVG